MTPRQTFAVVALGSNLGASEDILRQAFARLASIAGGGFRCSSLWRSSPVDCPPGSPDFLNAVAAFEPRAQESPESLLRQLQAWEREFGRQPKKRMNEARPLDLDLIVFGDEIRDTPGLILPHPRAAARRFVLEPLCEILPDLVPPGWPRSVRETLHGVRSANLTMESLGVFPRSVTSSRHSDS